MGVMNKKEWLLVLRQCTKEATLERVIEKKNYELTDAELAVFWGAADHRLAELIAGRLFDRVPLSMWKLIR